MSRKRVPDPHRDKTTRWFVPCEDPCDRLTLLHLCLRWRMLCCARETVSSGCMLLFTRDTHNDMTPSKKHTTTRANIQRDPTRCTRTIFPGSRSPSSHPSDDAVIFSRSPDIGTCVSPAPSSGTIKRRPRTYGTAGHSRQSARRPLTLTSHRLTALRRRETLRGEYFHVTLCHPLPTHPRCPETFRISFIA